MNILIDIPEEVYKNIQSKSTEIQAEGCTIENAILNGTPLPKRHGDLIDKSKIYKAIPAEEDNCTGMGMTYEEMDAYNNGINAMYSHIKNAPTIIEADKAESEDEG